jgi:hypothetical protein
LVAGITVKVTHITELRNATNVARAAGGLSPAAWQDTITSGFLIRAEHITEFHNAVITALAVSNIPVPTYTDPVLTVGKLIMAAHITT